MLCLNVAHAEKVSSRRLTWPHFFFPNEAVGELGHKDSSEKAELNLSRVYLNPYIVYEETEVLSWEAGPHFEGEVGDSMGFRGCVMRLCMYLLRAHTQISLVSGPQLPHL